MTAFAVVLDPVEVAVNRTELHLNDVGGAIQIASVDWGDAAIQQYLGDQKYGSKKIDYRVPNRQVVITMIVGGDGNQTTFNAARKKLTQKVGLLQRKWGWLKRQAGLYADIVNATLHIPDTLGETGAVEPNAVLTLECLPDFYGDEITLNAAGGVGASASSVLLTDIANGGPIRGDYPGRARIIVPGSPSNDDHHLIWGFRSEHYDSALTALLAIDTTQLTPLNGATLVTDATAFGGDAIQIATPAGTWVSMLSTLMTQNLRSPFTSPFASAVDNALTGSVAWTNPTDCINNIQDGTRVTLGANAISHNLQLTNVGVAPFSSTTQILGIKVEIIGKADSTFIQDASIQLIKGGALAGTSKASATPWFTGSDGIRTYGGATDLWGTTLTGADVAASNFGVSIAVKAVGTADNAYITQVVMTVYYIDTASPQNLTHQGSYRVFARVKSTNGTPQVRLMWSAGASQFNVNAPDSIPFINNQALLDLGEIRVDPQPLGAPQWTGVFQTLANVDNDVTQIDEVLLVPVDETGGQLVVVPQPPQSLSAVQQVTKTWTDNSAVGTAAWSLAYADPSVNFPGPSGVVHSHYLQTAGLGFAIPSGATIKGIQVDITRYMPYAGKQIYIKDEHVQLLKAGVVQATDRSGGLTWVSAPTTVTFGGASDLWGTTWSPADINNANFGTVLAAVGLGSGSSTGVGKIRSVNVTVYYTLGNDFVVAQDAVIYKASGSGSQQIEVRTDGIFRSDSTGVIPIIWQPFSGEVQGDLPRIPCSGLEGRQVELFMRRSATDLQTIADTLDGMGVSVIYRPCYLSRN